MKERRDEQTMLKSILICRKIIIISFKYHFYLKIKIENDDTCISF